MLFSPQPQPPPPSSPAPRQSGAPAIVGGPRFPTTTNEYITVMAHFHRAEIARMAGWRDRIDRTTNWAITMVAAMLSVSLSTPLAHHGVLLFAMLLTLLLLIIEARRYRFFDVYRNRVRLLERNYYADVLAPAAERSDDWAHALSDSLRQPRFSIPLGEALTRRMRRNYVWMFLVLLIAWLLKASSREFLAGHLDDPTSGSLAHWITLAAIGPVSGLAVLAVVAAFYVWVLYIAARRPKTDNAYCNGEAHV